MSSSLAELQARFQSNIRDRTDDVVSSLKVPEKADARGRLAVYQNAYKLRLASILESEYPVLRAFLGEEAFMRLADRYIDAYPSHHPNARKVSVGLAEFLRSDPRYDGETAAGDIAALENAVSGAFDAPDAELATMQELAGQAPETIPEMPIVFCPSVSLITLTTHAEEICQAVWNDQPVPAARERSGPTHMLVWRQDLGSKFRAAEAEEAMLVAEAMKGKTFGVLCEMASVMGEEETAAARLAGYLTEWINAQMVRALD